MERRTFVLCPATSIDALRATLTTALGRDCSGEVSAPWAPLPDVGPPVVYPWPETHYASSAQMTVAEVDAVLPHVLPDSALWAAGVRVWAEVSEGVDDQPGASVPYRADTDLDALAPGVVAIVDLESPAPVLTVDPRLRWRVERIYADLAAAAAYTGLVSGVGPADPFWSPP